MRLGRKNLWYSMALACVMLLFLVGYFMYMLPSLYVDYVMDQNLKSIRAQHKAYMETGSYEGVRVSNSTACISLDIPGEGDYVLITGKAFSVEVSFWDERLNAILGRCRRKLLSAQDDDQAGGEIGLEAELEELGEILQEALQTAPSLPVRLRWRYLRDMDGEFYNESMKIHSYSDGVFIIEASIEDDENQYTNYIAVERTEERIVLSLLPVVAPAVEEIRPVVLQSLPMLGAVIVLIVLLGSQLYSKGIVRPIIALVRHAEEMKLAEDFSVERLSGKWSRRKDEVRELADALDDLYGQIKESYQNLEEKNRELAEENERQEIFLRASSHQLKTPVAAALLLVEGMMNEIGRYKETKVYLPKVKEQLLSMRKMVEDILYLNHCAENMRIQPTDVGKLLEEKLQSYQVARADRLLTVDFPGDRSLPVDTDEMMVSQILDNLISNAVRYTPVGGHIRLLLCGGERRGIRIENFGVRIPEEIAPHIFEPFVSGSHGQDASGARSHGLGLYIASYYAKKLGISLEVRNGEDSVVTIVSFPDT